MDKLHLGVEIRDFDLERMGFSFSVLDEANSRQLSEGYLDDACGAEYVPEGAQSGRREYRSVDDGP